MAYSPFSTSPSYSQYSRGVRDLHALIAADRDDSPEADEIRDSMDHPWYELSETEQKRIKGLSEDLYSISDPPQAPLPTNPQVERKLDEVEEAIRAGRWDEALELLRRWRRYVDPADLSFARGVVWHAAGDDETAVAFFEHAAKLQPTNTKYNFLYLSLIENLKPELAVNLANEIIANEESRAPELVILAAGIVFQSYERSGENLRTTPVRLIPVLERALVRAQRPDAGDINPSAKTRVLAAQVLGRCYAFTGNSMAAIRWFDLAIEGEPYDWRLWLDRGISRYGVDHGVVEDFERAIELGCDEVGPHFCLAHSSGVAGRFEECLKHCEKGLMYPAVDGVRAILHEWLAISHSELGHPLDLVRTEFEEAIRLAPDATRIQENLALFEATLASSAKPNYQWIEPNASMVQALGSSEIRLPSLSLLPAA
jgi:Flp pilus assembly protein TadD